MRRETIGPRHRSRDAACSFGSGRPQPHAGLGPRPRGARRSASPISTPRARARARLAEIRRGSRAGAEPGPGRGRCRDQGGRGTSAARRSDPVATSGSGRAAPSTRPRPIYPATGKRFDGAVPRPTAPRDPDRCRDEHQPSLAPSPRSEGYKRRRRAAREGHPQEQSPLSPGTLSVKAAAEPRREARRERRGRGAGPLRCWVQPSRRRLTPERRRLAHDKDAARQCPLSLAG